MVLGEPGNRIAELVSEPGLLGDLGKNLCCRLFGVARSHQIEDAKFHRPFLCFVASGSGDRVTNRDRCQLARVLLAMGHPAQALALSDTALAGHDKALGPNDPWTKDSARVT